MSPVNNILAEGTANAPADLLRLNTPKRYQNRFFLSPKRYDEHTRAFYMVPPPPPHGHLYNNNGEL